MIFKERDSSVQSFSELGLAMQNTMAVEHRRRLERELAQHRAGARAEQEAAYHINFHLKASPNWAVIHDLRIECKGRVAQMDHLLISRYLEIYLVESKSFRTKIRYANGGWERINLNRWEAIPSPVDQNQSDIVVLAELIQHHRLAPSRFATRLAFHSIIAVQPSCSLIGPIPDEARIYRMDRLVREIRREDPSAIDHLKVVSREALSSFATSLVACHAKGPKSNAASVTGENVIKQSSTAVQVKHECSNCCRHLSRAETTFCLVNKPAFAGQFLCRKCQAYFPRVTATPSLPTVDSIMNDTDIAAQCESCGNGVDGKLVAFCRFGSKPFGGRVLCRSCQESSSTVSLEERPPLRTK